MTSSAESTVKEETRRRRSRSLSPVTYSPAIEKIKVTFVPTGMNTGVSTVACGRAKRPTRAREREHRADRVNVNFFGSQLIVPPPVGTVRRRLIRARIIKLKGRRHKGDDDGGGGEQVDKTSDVHVAPTSHRDEPAADSESIKKIKSGDSAAPARPLKMAGVHKLVVDHHHRVVNKSMDPGYAGDGLPEKWVPVKLSFVEYPQGDLIGKILAYTSLSPVFIVSGFIALILFRRDLHTILFFLGVVLNEILNAILKAIIAEPRPMTRNLSLADYGMPSSHSQFIWFFTTYVTFFVFARLHHMNNNTTLEYFWKTVIVAGCVLLAILTSYSRVYLMYHSWQQVICGSIVGAVVGLLWFALVHMAATPYFPLIASWKISELMLIRDTTLIPNVLWFEYTNARQEARARSRKLVSMKSQ